MTQKGTLSGARLVHSLQQLADGVDKHKGEPDFPNYFATNDVRAELDMVGNALLAEKATVAVLHLAVTNEKGQRAAAMDLYARSVAAVESYFGADSPTLVVFGIRPRKGRYSPSSKLTKAAHKRKAKLAAAKANAPARATPAPVAAPAPSPGGAS